MPNKTISDRVSDFTRRYGLRLPVLLAPMAGEISPLSCGAWRWSGRCSAGQQRLDLTDPPA